MEQRLFLRMYGDELPPAVIERALARIARGAAASESDRDAADGKPAVGG